MSFRCDSCKRPQNPIKGEPTPRPVSVVVERHPDGQIKKEARMCEPCAEAAVPAPLPPREPTPIGESESLGTLGEAFEGRRY